MTAALIGTSLVATANAAAPAASGLVPARHLDPHTPIPAGSCAARTPDELSCFSIRAGRLTHHEVDAVATHQRGLHAHASGLAPRAGTGTAPPYGYGPADIEAMYGVLAGSDTVETVAIIGVGQDPTIAADLAKYRSKFGLPACTKKSGCFTELAQNNGDVPVARKGWIGEISLDVEAVSAICPLCHITLVDALDATNDSLYTAAQDLAAEGIHYVSMSFGGPESSLEVGDEDYFDDPATVYFAPSGDNGWDDGSGSCNGLAVCYPAAVPQVVAVGGVRTTQTTSNYYFKAWKGAGSGCAELYPAHPAQVTAINNACNGGRAISDISALADPQTGAVTYDSVHGWQIVGGTSLSTPLMAGLYAQSGNYTDPFAFYSSGAADAGLILDVTAGSEIGCDGTTICRAGTGWDGPTGVGVPLGPQALAVGPAAPLRLTRTAGTSLALALNGYPVAASPVAAQGNTAGIHWSATGLPAGLTINASTGALTGTPTSLGASKAIFSVTNTAGNTADYTLALRIIDAYECTSRQTANVGQRLAIDCGAYWSSAPNQGGTWSPLPGQITYAAANLPPGLTLNTRRGLVKGAPTQAGFTKSTLTTYVEPDGVLLTSATQWSNTMRFTIS